MIFFIQSIQSKYPCLEKFLKPSFASSPGWTPQRVTLRWPFSWWFNMQGASIMSNFGFGMEKTMAASIVMPGLVILQRVNKKSISKRFPFLLHLSWICPLSFGVNLYQHAVDDYRTFTMINMPNEFNIHGSLFNWSILLHSHKPSVLMFQAHASSLSLGQVWIVLQYVRIFQPVVSMIFLNCARVVQQGKWWVTSQWSISFTSHWL
jgi:hypothetical protein